MYYIWRLKNLDFYKDKLKPQAIFDITNVAKYVYSIDQEIFDWEEHSICFIPPFKQTWFEFLVPELLNSEGTITKSPLSGFRCGAYIRYEKCEDGFVISIDWFNNAFTKANLISQAQDCSGRQIIICNRWGKPQLMPIGDSVDKGWPIVMNDDYKQYFNEPTNVTEEGHQITDISMGTHAVYITALNFLHCKNVKAEEIAYPKKTIKHHRRAGKPFFEKYYVLDIDKQKSHLNTQGNAEEEGLAKAFHICRGHFKTYTEKNPLFGKYTGTYWWTDFTRGDIEVGKIHKDYTIKEAVGREIRKRF